MKRFHVVHAHEALPVPLVLEADEASVGWVGHLRFFSAGRMVAEFVPRSWAAWWEADAMVAPEKPEKDAGQPKPYTGPLTPVDRPAGWMR